MFRVEDLSKKSQMGEIQHLQSSVVVAENDSGSKVSTYFYPSLVFPNQVEITSITLLYNSKGKPDNVVVKLAYQDSKSNVPTIKTEDEYILKHSPGKLVTTLIYPKPIVIGVNSPFYFFFEGEALDSALTVSYKNMV
jgi:hypothetical protein